MDNINKEIYRLEASFEAYSTRESRERVRRACTKKRKSAQAEESAAFLKSKRSRIELENDMNGLTLAVTALVHSCDRLLRLCELRRRQVSELTATSGLLKDSTWRAGL